MGNQSTLSAKAIAWQAHLQLWRESGLVPSEFCTKQQLRLKSFYQWRSKLAPVTKPPKETKPATLIPLEITPERNADAATMICTTQAGIRLEVKGVALELFVGFDAGTLNRVLDVLGRHAHD